MGERGFTLVELIVVVGAIAVLLSIAALNFNSMNQKSMIDAQMRSIHTDLAEVRQKALYEKSARVVKLTATQFAVYAGSSTSGTPTLTRTLSVPVAWSTADDPLVIVFDTFGVAQISATTCVCAKPTADNPATADSLVITATKTELGKRDSGGSCAETSIALK